MDIFSNFGLWGAGWTGWIIPFLFGLSVVVFFHELGHFLVARWCGVRVLTFSVGFGPEIVGFNDRYGTRWKLSCDSARRLREVFWAMTTPRACRTRPPSPA